VRVRDNPITVFAEPAFEEPLVEIGGMFGGLIIVSAPEAVCRVLVENAENYAKSPQQQRRIQPALGDGLLTAEGRTWRSQRRVVAPLFTPRALGAYFDDMVDLAEAMVARWDGLAGDRRIDMSVETHRLTYEIISRTMFSGALDEDRVRVHEQMALYFDTIGRVDLSSFLNLPEWVPTFAQFRARPALAGFHEVVSRAVGNRNRRDGKSEHHDLLDRLSSARDPKTGETMPDRIVLDNMLTFLAAGHETTANALVWIAYLLATYPWADDALADELDGVVGARRPIYDDIGRLEFTRAIIDEALRLYPPAPFLGRLALQDDVLCDRPVRAGTQILIAPWIVHRHRLVWDEPEYFMPQRFLEGRRDTIPRGAYIPFGLGPRVCIGQGFAIQEILIVLAIIARRYRFELLEPQNVEPVSRVTLSARGGLPVRLVARA
jgi:cytochrome P450